MGFISNVRQKVRSWLEIGEEKTAMEKREAENKENKELRRRYRRAAERLTENSSLRDELNDDQAKQVLDWGNNYLKKVVDKTADLTDNDATHILDTQTERVSGVVRQVNQLTRAIKMKDQQQLVDHYKTLTLKINQLKEEVVDLPVNVEEWLSLSEENTDWMMKQLLELVDGEEE